MHRLRRGQRLFGLLVLATSAPAIWFVWHSAQTSGHYSRSAAALLPAVSFLGLGLALFPFDVDGLRTLSSSRDDDAVPRLPVVWQIILLAAVLAGLANWYAIALSL
jgi:hypothetical protein